MPAARPYPHLLGLLRLLEGDQPGEGFNQARPQRLLAYLVLHRTAPIARQQLAFLSRPDSTDQQALKYLRPPLTRLRRALPDADHFPAVTAQTIQWCPDARSTPGVAEFEAAVAQAAAAQARGEHAACQQDHRPHPPQGYGGLGFCRTMPSWRT